MNLPARAGRWSATPPQDRDLRLARLRRRRVHGRQHDRRQSAHRRRSVHRRVPRRREGARRRRPAADRGGRAAAERHAHRSTTPSSRRRSRTSPRRLAKVQYVENVEVAARRRRPRSPTTATRRSSTSTIAGDSIEAKDRVDPTLAATAAVQAEHPDMVIEQFGGASADKAINDDDHRRHRQGGRALAADHADHPHDHLRLAGRRGRAAADRPHLGARRARPRRDPEPGARRSTPTSTP